MKTRILTILITLISIGGFSQTEESNSHKKISTKFQTNYNKEDYSSIFEMFAQNMKDALPLEKTTNFLKGLKFQAGNIKERSFIEYNTKDYASYKTTFEKGTFKLHIHLNKSNEIDGLLVQPFPEEESVKKK